MQIIKDKQIVVDSWHVVEDVADLVAGDITVSLARWLKDKAQLKARPGKIGVRILPADNISELADDLADIVMIDLHFPAFADGRLFSHAWLLRGRYGYQGELRATGNFLPDQVFYLSRVGVNAFCPARADDLTATLASLNSFSVNYQASIN